MQQWMTDTTIDAFGTLIVLCSTKLKIARWAFDPLTGLLKSKDMCRILGILVFIKGLQQFNNEAYWWSERLLIVHETFTSSGQKNRKLMNSTD